MNKQLLAIIGIAVFALISCSSNNDTDASDSTNTDIIVDGEPTIDTSLFSSFSRIRDFELVDCTLSDGTVTKCYKVVYENVRENITVICPEFETDLGGVGIYTGANGLTGEGLRALDSDLWADFATDGYDIINDDGTVNIQIPIGGPGSGFIDEGSGINGSCLDAILNESFQITYYIPAYPTKTTTSSTTRSLAYWGISLDGFPFAEQPPASASAVGVAIPGLDACGGHPQPDGPFHYHLIPQVIDNLFDSEGIDRNCSYITQSSNTILGYARDGFPMYGYEDSDGTTPSDLDNCQGHTYATTEFPNGIYHYHITNVINPNSAAGYTNTLPCTYGATVASEEFASVQ
tara:strand:- start:59275 stop:60315 length:1041 start_codon:yes stop_codon:yes gene_type:complete